MSEHPEPERRKWHRTIKVDPHGDLGPAEEWVSISEADAALATAEAQVEAVREALEELVAAIKRDPQQAVVWAEKAERRALLTTESREGTG